VSGVPPAAKVDSELCWCVEYADDELYDSQAAKPMSRKARPLSRLLAIAPGDGRNSLQQRIDRKKRGIGRQRYPFVGEQIAFIALHVIIDISYFVYSMDACSGYARCPDI
jgi:hypothetical protein